MFHFFRKKQENIEKVNSNIQGENNKVEFLGENLSELINITIIGNNNNIFFDEYFYARKLDIFISANNCNINIGKGTTIEQAVITLGEDDVQINVGQDCMFSTDVLLLGSDFHSIVKNSMGGGENDIQRLNKAIGINIGNHVWIGYGAKILKNVSIGSNSIIGAYSVVTKSVDSYSTVCGNPAKVIRVDEGINWDRRNL